jgi:hypothetical protein
MPALRRRHRHPRQGGAKRRLSVLPHVLEHRQRSLRILQKAAAATRIEPLIPLGSVGRFGGRDWTVIGFQQRAVTAEGKDYPWQEYLLHHPRKAFAGWSNRPATGAGSAPWRIRRATATASRRRSTATRSSPALPPARP